MSLICYATRTHFADGVLEDALALELRRVGARAAMVVTDAAGAAGAALQRLTDAWPAEVARLPLAALADPGALAPAAGPVDAIVGMGGRAALDRARALVARPAGDRVHLLAVPTTPGAVGLARPGPGPAAVPDVILCDPTLLADLAAPVLAAADMAALTDCLEALLGSAWNPPADGIAWDGLRRAGRWLAPALADRRAPEPRRQLLAAGLNAGLAAQKGYGALHALAGAVEAALDPAPPPGWLRAALAGPVLAFNAPAAAARLALAAEALGLPPGPEGAAGAEMAEALIRLGRAVGLPADLAGLGLRPADLDRIAVAAAEDPSNRTNPRHATPRDYRAMLDAAGPARDAGRRRPRLKMV